MDREPVKAGSSQGYKGQNSAGQMLKAYLRGNKPTLSMWWHPNGVTKKILRIKLTGKPSTSTTAKPTTSTALELVTCSGGLSCTPQSPSPHTPIKCKADNGSNKDNNSILLTNSPLSPQECKHHKKNASKKAREMDDNYRGLMTTEKAHNVWEFFTSWKEAEADGSSKLYCKRCRDLAQKKPSGTLDWYWVYGKKTTNNNLQVHI
ncbi:hypothetical protein FRB98_009057 [Tulasnella sp. 332]|nr:hypothetical protein FRB98_009057 [Tulasnella sp. 332]